MSEIALQFIYESLCYFARVDETNARQMTLTYIDRGLLTDAQIANIRNILNNSVEGEGDEAVQAIEIPGENTMSEPVIEEQPE